MSRPFTINGLQRGTVIRPAGPKGEWSGFYGRVLKVINLGLVVTVDCGKHCEIQHINEIEADGYRGRFVVQDDGYRSRSVVRHYRLSEREHWLAMPNMRYLKRICRIYNPRLIPRPSDMVRKLLEADPHLLDGIEHQHWWDDAEGK